MNRIANTPISILKTNSRANTVQPIINSTVATVFLSTLQSTKPSVNPKNTVNFFRIVSVILIPTKKELEQAGLKNTLWWAKAEYDLLQSSAASEIREYAIFTGVPFLKAMENLYQSNPEAVTNSKIKYGSYKG